MEEAINTYNENYLMSPRQRRQSGSKRANAKIEDICAKLRALAMEKGAGSKLPSVRELCEELQTSKATLTDALDLLEAERIVVRKERMGIFVGEVTDQKWIHIVFNIGGFTDTGKSPFWSLMLGRVVQETEQRSAFKHEKYQFHFLCQPFGLPLTEHFADFLNTSRIDGCLLIGVMGRDFDHRRLVHIPHVVLYGGGDIIVNGDGDEQMRLGGRWLSEQGCKNAEYWFTTNVHETREVREENYAFIRQKLAAAGVAVHADACRDVSTYPLARELSWQEQGYMLANEVFGSRGKKPDGIYITDDMMTMGALVAMGKLGIVPGRDVKMVSLAHAESPILFGYEENLARVEYNLSDFVRAMFAELDTVIAKGYVPSERVIAIRPRLRVPSGMR